MNFLAKSGGMLTTTSGGSRCASSAGSASGSPDTRTSPHFAVSPPTSVSPFSISNSSGAPAQGAGLKPKGTPSREELLSEEAVSESSEAGSARGDAVGSSCGNGSAEKTMMAGGGGGAGDTSFPGMVGSNVEELTQSVDGSESEVGTSCGGSAQAGGLVVDDGQALAEGG